MKGYIGKPEGCAGAMVKLLREMERIVKIEVIKIAEEKIKRRGINEEWIKETIENPDQIVRGYGNREVAQKIYEIEGDKKLLRVIYENKYVVITAYLTSQINKYWRRDENTV